MSVTANTASIWQNQQRHWAAVYADQLPAQLDRVISLVQSRKSKPDELSRHFASFMMLLDKASHRKDLEQPWLRLVDELHPLPLRWRKWDEWLSVLMEAVRRYGSIGDKVGQAQYLAYSAELLRKRSRLEQAFEVAERAANIALQAGVVLPFAQASSTAVASLRFQGKNDAARASLSQADLRLDTIEADVQSADLILPRALLDVERMDVLRTAGELEIAVALGEQVVATLEANPVADPHRMASIYRRRATIYWAATRYQDSLNDLERSAELFEIAGDPLEALFSNGNIGFVFRAMARYDQAEAKIREAVAAGEALNAAWRLIRDMGNLVGVFLGQGKLEAALIYAQRHLDLARRYGDDAEQSRATNNRAAVRMYLGDIEGSLPELQSAYDRYYSQDRPEGYLSAMIDLAIANHLMGDQAGCRKYVDTVFEHPSTTKYPMLHILALRARALCAEPNEARQALEEALMLTRKHGRKLDEAGSIMALVGLSCNEDERLRLWDEGVTLLLEMGANAWLDTRSPDNPPFIAFLL